MKNNYNYNEDGFFTGISIARLDIKATDKYGKDVYLSPRNSTKVPIPDITLEMGEVFRWDGSGWIVCEKPTISDDIISDEGSDDSFDELTQGEGV